jgi:hypothetical protein
MNIFRVKGKKLVLEITKYLFVFLVAFVLIRPVFADPCTGQDNTGTPTPYGCTSTIDNTQQNSSTIDNTKPNTDTGIKINSGIKNPLGNGFGSDIPTFLESVLNFFLLIGIPIITLAIIYCGFLFVTAQGNSEKLKKAKQALLYTIVGAALLLGSLVITRAIQGTVDEIKTNNK